MNVKKVTVPNAEMLGLVSDLIGEGKSTVIMTKGVSMLPFIRGGRDSVELVPPEGLQVGDIVLAQIAPGRFVLHRLICLDNELAVLKGDGNLDGTERCKTEDICGKVGRILRRGEVPIDCGSQTFGRRSSRWRNSPRWVRRIILAIFRRIKI